MGSDEQLTAGSMVQSPPESSGQPPLESRTLSRWIAVVTLLTVLPLAVLGGIAIESQRSGASLVEPSAVYVPSERHVHVERRQIEVTPTWQATTIRAPSWVGLVTAVHVEVGHELSSGTPILAIDGIERVAVLTPEPFYRVLEIGSVGADVEMLHDLMTEVGLLDEVPEPYDRFSPATRRAVMGFERTIGVERPSGIFDPAWVVHLPSEPWAVTEFLVEAGQHAPVEAEPFAVGGSVLVRAELSNFEAGPLELDSEATWVLDLPGGGAGASAEDEGEDRAVAVDPVRSVVEEADLDFLAATIPLGAESVSGSVRRVDALEVVVVPTSAIGTDVDGNHCVWGRSGSTLTPVSVVVVGARAGATWLSPDHSAPDEVLANPSEVFPGTKCP